MNNVINYLIIFILTLISIVALINISKVEQKLKLKGTTIVLFFIILMTYLTLISYPVKNIFNKYITDIKLPKGNKGPRGDRGKGGSNAVCDTCGDDLCLKKILFNITNTYNYWRQLNGLKTYPDTYVIKNEYLKDKILKHCKSAEFQKIIKKYGSNNKNCPQDLSEYGCGAYDYMFKLWSIWILIILKYKNGIFFLESDSLTDVDFDGLIEKEDCFLHSDIVIHKDEKYIIDKSKESKRIHPMYHIINKTNPSNKKIVHISQLILCTENTSVAPLTDTEKNNSVNPNRSWKNMFSDSDSDSKAGLKIKRIKRNFNKAVANVTAAANAVANVTAAANVAANTNAEISFSAIGVNDSFFKNSGIPSRGKLSPFDEIKKYDAWYWGRDEKLKPEIIVTKPFVSDFKKTCPEGRVKFLKTNKYYEIFTSKYKKYNRSSVGNNITIDEIMGNFNTSGSNDVLFLRPSKIIDPNEHGYFKEYKPIGDILISESDRTTDENSNTCKPTYPINNFSEEINKAGYDKQIKKKITNRETYLVSGDTKSPVDFEYVWSYKKEHGLNRGFLGISIWKPIAPAGYKALGYVVDNRYYDGQEVNRPKPSFDSVACVPDDLTLRNSPNFSGSNNPNWTEVNSSFFNKSSSTAQNFDVSSTKSFFRNNHTNTFVSSADLVNDSNIDVRINESSTIKCHGSIAPICDGTTELECNPDKCVWEVGETGIGKCSIKQHIPINNRSSIKDKKYSILKLYD